MKYICKMCMTENKSASVLAERGARNWVTTCSEGQQKRPYKSQTLEKLTEYELWRVSGQKAGGSYILSSWTSHVFPPAKELITWVPGTTQCSRTTDTSMEGCQSPGPSVMYWHPSFYLQAEDQKLASLKAKTDRGSHFRVFQSNSAAPQPVSYTSMNSTNCVSKTV